MSSTQAGGPADTVGPAPAAADSAPPVVPDAPPAVPLTAKWPVGELMGAVDAIQEHHDQEVQEHRLQEAQAGQQQGATLGAAAATGANGGSASAGAPGGSSEAAVDGEGKPLGYPGTFFLEKPLTGAAANTLTRMWGGPPPGGPGYPAYPPQQQQQYPGAPAYPPQPGYPGYPPAGGPSYPPAASPGYPPAGGPGYPPAAGPGYPPAAGPGNPFANGAALTGQHPPQYPGYPSVGAGAPPSQPPASSPGYPTVHHTASPQQGAPKQGEAAGPLASAPSYGAPASAPSYGAPQASAPPYGAPQHQPQQAGHAADPRYTGVPPAMPPAGAGAGKKKALIVGINYFRTSAELRGCINDAKCMEYLLKSKFGFRQENILMMTDDHPDPLRRPTKANMMQGFRWLMMDLHPGDSLVFHFSGHGSQKRDYSGEETDGMNETLCPLDFKQAGEIVDDDLNRILINPLPKGVKLHAIIDACHSGSMMDLPFQSHVRGGYAQWESSYHFTRSHKGTAGGFAVQFGASKDSQTAADTQALAGNTSTGAATFCFIQAIEKRGTKLTYGELLLAMHNTLQATMGKTSSQGSSSSMGGLGSMLGSMLGGSSSGGGGSSGSGGMMGMLLGAGTMMAGGGSGYKGQEPVMSANYAFDMAYPFGL